MSVDLFLSIRVRRTTPEIRVLEVTWHGENGRKTLNLPDPKWFAPFLQAAHVSGLSVREKGTNRVAGILSADLPTLETELRDFFATANGETMALVSGLRAAADLDAAIAPLREKVALQGDVIPFEKGKVPQRVERQIAGKWTGRILGKAFRGPHSQRP